ncbi:MAG TPA: hypothetical protein DDZ58_06765 [Achromobacter sp.]|nr:hypothetical protein [Achromobacter sp.]
MKWMFSASMQEFYNLAGEPEDRLPADCVEVSSAVAEKLLGELESGDRLLIVQEDGRPSTVPRIVFSPSELMFFHSGINSAAAIPSDSVPVSVSLANDIQAQLALGRVIAANPDGQPITLPRPPEPQEAVAARVLAQRDALLAEAAIRIAPLQDAVDLGIPLAGDEARLQAWKRYRIALNRVESNAGFPRNVSWPTRPEAVV